TALDPDAESRLVHEGEDLLPAISRFPERRRARAFEQQRTGRRSADHELVLGALDNVVLVLAIGDEHAQTVEPGRAGDASREHDDHVALPGRDELLTPLKDPAAVLARRRGRR